MALRKPILKLITTRRPLQCISRVRAYNTQERESPSVAATRERPKQTHFGFQTVHEEEKWKKVHDVFETVAEKYDVMNDAMSFGIHRVWKDFFMQRLAPTHGTRLIDVAGGTGDISFRYVNYLRNLGAAPEGKRSSVTVCDINQAMLDVGKARANKHGLTSEKTGVDMNWLCSDAEKLSVPDETYTAYTIAFGVRNCTHVDKVVRSVFVSSDSCVGTTDSGTVETLPVFSGEHQTIPKSGEIQDDD
ncbi:2-methoxy-6-polyprenyl-1,4-benzoquinol methylase, mitochondrial isoform X2 [Hyposmocoma kahamanoa]|uniref:2-methoxy-6-polyprenyl-1,4-benzoquinol methylase, mitochondrial isoform X2 n=1 Tax=Hyposmocoma kahamanoa TaxID=1477025 RepID=UPI000E6D8E56|nr:2-methoxy-6-polyprenyl-1,4-benzoquinol methylase, mitochondrial isoform X2 [Hyposmocoma kahamanoa]